MIKQNPGQNSLPGVSCDVATCLYNSADHHCHAQHIQVANQTRTNGDKLDTFCGTYEAK